MTVIVLHSSDEMKILNISKQICSFLSSNSIISYRDNPLWIPFPLEQQVQQFQKQIENNSQSKSQIFQNDDLQSNFSNEKEILKEHSNKISNIIIYSPKALDDTIFCPVTIDYNNQIFNSKLTLLKVYKQNKEYKSLSNTDFFQKKIAASELFPMQLKIFRLARQIQLSKNSVSLSDFVWKKL